MPQELKADSHLSLAVHHLVNAAVWETRGDETTARDQIRWAMHWAERYEQDWVYDFMYEKPKK